ncbi:hypothetical protein DPMN_111489 [Dreissena polymorpha]|uniref:Uncharacterized protein n=1 Tax=Dreissena polymorpha TaxID=45954 RepID=A0A9D4KEK0_DREPO|nr:hypothetical protein DPMN_111489 [Dreissena polymorpha]
MCIKPHVRTVGGHYRCALSPMCGLWEDTTDVHKAPCADCGRTLQMCIKPHVGTVGGHYRCALSPMCGLWEDTTDVH